MVCPLRFIVAGVSVAIALVVLLWSEWDRFNTKQQAEEKKEDKSQSSTSLFSQFISLFTGRFLLNQCQAMHRNKQRVV